MRTIYGMAKSYSNLKGSKVRGLELDFLRLALAIDRDEFCTGAYLVAPLPQKSGDSLVSEWNGKYGLGKPVMFLEAILTEDEERLLHEEKARNRRSNQIKGSLHSNASYGEKLIERKLKEHVEHRHARVDARPHFTAPVMPHVKWDFFGILED